MQTKTSIWEKYEKGRDYLDKKALVSKTDKNWAFFSGDQWRGLQSGGEKMPILNFIKPVIKYKGATVSQNVMTAVYNDMEERTTLNEACKMLGRIFTRNWEKAKMDYNAWKIIRAAAVQGDSYIYFGTNDVRDAQIIHNTQIMFGDEQEPRIQRQPYIIIYERLRVEDIKKVAKANKIPRSEIDLIVGDEETTHQIGNKVETKGSDKCVSLLYFEKRDGIVWTGRATQYCEYEKLHPIATKRNDETVGGLRSYPVVNFIWEELPNNARGNSEVEQLIPNQIEINKTLARRSMSVKMTAFPRIAYDANAIQNEEDLEKVGAAIALNGAAGNVDTMIKYLNPASMSHDAEQLLNDLLNISRDLAGAGDAATGNIDPERASGAAITAVRDQQALPLNEQVSAYRQFVEDIASLWFDMLVAYEPNGIQFEYTDETNEPQKGLISAEELAEIKPNIKIDVSTDNGWTKYAEQQELVNLLTAGHITFEEYLEALPDGSPLPKNKLTALMQRRKENVQMQEMRPGVSADGAQGIQGALPQL